MIVYLVTDEREVDRFENCKIFLRRDDAFMFVESMGCDEHYFKVSSDEAT